MLLKKLLLCVMVMMLIAMSCILLFNHYVSLTGMVPRTLDCVLYIESMYTWVGFLNTTTERIQHVQ